MLRKKLKRIIKNAEEEEKSRQSKLKHRKDKDKESEIVLTKEAEKVRNEFRRNLDEGK